MTEIMNRDLFESVSSSRYWETVGSLTRIVPGAKFEIYGKPEYVYVASDEQIIWIGPLQEIEFSFEDAEAYDELEQIKNLKIGESVVFDECNFYLRIA